MWTSPVDCDFENFREIVTGALLGEKEIRSKSPVPAVKPGKRARPSRATTIFAMQHSDSLLTIS
jgi:hypothetical protein